MTAIPDTHAYIRRLTEVGFTEAQAEAQVTIWLDWIKADLATKQDLKDLETALRDELHQEIGKVRQEIGAVRVEIRDTKIDLMKWMVTALFLQAGLIVALIKLLPGPTG